MATEWLLSGYCMACICETCLHRGQRGFIKPKNKAPGLEGLLLTFLLKVMCCSAITISSASAVARWRSSACVLCVVCGVLCVVCRVPCAVCCVLCVVCCVFCVVCCMLCCAVCGACCVSRAVCCVLCVVCGVWRIIEKRGRHQYC